MNEVLRAAAATAGFPDARGRYGAFGGRYVPETLVPALDRLQMGVERYLHDAEFLAEFNHELKTWVGRPTALSFATTLSKRWGAEIWLKREDLAHTGAHKINNAVGQTLLAKRLGAKRIIAETGAGQHGVASAAAAARLGMPCVVYMGAVDVERQAPNVGRMQLLGATVVPVTGGDQTLRAAIDEALRDWVSDPNGTYYCLGSAVGPHPYPYLVRELQAVIGREARAQMLAMAGGLPDAAVACVGGGSNAIGLFHPFLDDAAVTLIGVEAGGRGTGLGDNAASLTFGTPGVLQGSYTLILQDAFGQVRETHSVSAGLDYSGVGPEHTNRRRMKKPWMRWRNVPSSRASCRPSKALMPSSVRAGLPEPIPAREFSSAAPAGATRTCPSCCALFSKTWDAGNPADGGGARHSPGGHSRGDEAGPAGLGGFPDSRISDAPGFQEQPGRRRQRVRRGGNRRALQRSDGGRHHHTTSELCRPQERGHTAVDIRRAQFAGRAALGAHSSDELFEPAALHGTRCAAARGGGGRRRRLHRSRSAVRGKR
jgi:tryptophan synthase beta chain